uniref:Germin-like protein 9-2 n=1 Tax=Nicotiana tabacum TaxID=4097 RepID=A0A1S3ZSA5_TOBAC|nr:PREDICTED: putative germin-like protein 9-2 [Nicotiana tabacum]
MIVSPMVLTIRTDIFVILRYVRGFAIAECDVMLILWKASKVEFPALDGQCTSLAALQFPGEDVNPPHTHPRASELLLVVQGSLEVGLLDSTTVVSAFGSANVGTISHPTALFATCVDDQILAK